MGLINFVAENQHSGLSAISDVISEVSQPMLANLSEFQHLRDANGIRPPKKERENTKKEDSRVSATQYSLRRDIHGTKKRGENAFNLKVQKSIAFPLLHVPAFIQ